MLTAFDTDVRREYTNVRWVGFHSPLSQHRWKCQISLLSNSLLPQMSLSSTFRDILVKKVILPKFANFLYFWEWICHAAAWFIFHGKEGGLHVLAGLAPSSQTVGYLLRSHWLASGQKNSVKSCFKNSLQWKNCTRLLLTKWIWGPGKSTYMFSVTFRFLLPRQASVVKASRRKAEICRRWVENIYVDLPWPIWHFNGSIR